MAQRDLNPDTWIDLKFIMADTGFRKTFIYDRIKDGTLPKPQKINSRSRWTYQQLIEFKNRLLSRSIG